jgi:hypothetical protein
MNSGTGTDETVWNGFTGQTAVLQQGVTLTTSWQRFSYTGSVPSNSNQLGFYIEQSPTAGTAGADDWFEVTGFQIDNGSTALPFRRSGGTIQGELAAAMRYYYRFNATNNFTFFGLTFAANATNGNATISLPVPMRVSPTAVDTSAANTFFLQQSSGATSYPLTTAPSLNSGTNSNVGCGINWGVASGLTTNAIYSIYANNTTSAYIGFSAEL